MSFYIPPKIRAVALGNGWHSCCNRTLGSDESDLQPGCWGDQGAFSCTVGLAYWTFLPIFQIVIAFSRLCDAHPSEAGIRVAEEQGAESGSVPAQGVLAYQLRTNILWKCGSVGEGLKKLSHSFPGTTIN